MKICLAQINPIVGDIDGNTDKIISTINKIKADLVVFPELSITGYSPQDLLLNQNFIKKNIGALKNIIKNTKNKNAIVGFVDVVGSKMYNGAALISNKKLIKVHHKICLPNYSVFDEKRWFAEGTAQTVFELSNKKIGLSICEDIWFPETARMQKKLGAELIINISASPYRKEKFRAIENVARQRWNENKIPIIIVNQVGAQDGIVFHGHSTYFNGGKIAGKCKDFEEDLLTVNL